MRKRVLFSALPTLLEDVLRSAFSDYTDIEVLGNVSFDESIWARILETRANALLVAETAIGDPAAAFRLLERCPNLRVVVLRSDARQATVHLDRVSIDDLVKAIRD